MHSPYVFLPWFSTQEMLFSYFSLLPIDFFKSFAAKIYLSTTSQRAVVSVKHNNLVFISCNCLFTPDGQWKNFSLGLPCNAMYGFKLGGKEKHKELGWTAKLIEPTLMWGIGRGNYLGNHLIVLIWRSINLLLLCF